MRAISCRVLCFSSIGILLAASAAADQRAAEDRAPQKRIAWTTSRVTGSPEPPAPYRTERAFPRLSFEQPVEVKTAPGADRLFVLELSGKLFSFPNDPDCRQADLALDLAQPKHAATRAYGLAFHPDFADNRFIYCCYVTERQDSRRHAGLAVSRDCSRAADLRSGE